MKQISAAAALICICLIARGQVPNNVYRHSISLANAVGDIADTVTWIQVLQNYVPPEDKGKISTQAGIKEYFKDNPFKFTDKMPQVGLKAQALFPNASLGGSVPSSLSAPVLAGALAQVIIQRAKEELAVSFFDHFKKELNKYPELDSLFPKTASFIKNIESYLYAGALNTLRQAFADDIANLPGRIPVFLQSPDIQTFIGNNPNFKDFAALVPPLAFIGKLLNGGSVGDAIKQLYPNTNVAAVNKNLYGVLQIIPILSESVRDTTRKKDWIDLTGEFKTNIIDNDAARTIFFGLLYEELKRITFVNSVGKAVTIDDIMPTKDAATIQNTITNIQATIKTVTDTYQDVQNALSAIIATKSKTDTPKIADVLDLIAKAAEDAKSTLLSVNILVGSSVIDQTKLDQVYSFIPQITAIIKNVYSQQYSSAAMNSFLLLSQFVLQDDKYVTQKVLKYASFMAAIVEAKTSDDIASALDAAILPVGSSSIKGNTSFSIALNSYIGAGYYKEYYKISGSTPVSAGLPTFGVSLPIGVSFNLGLRNKYLGSLSIFASVIDLGAIASFNLSTPDSVHSAALPNFTWQNLLAPGGYIVLGRLFNSPIAFGLGWQKGPQLRSITYTPVGGTVIDLSTAEKYRFGAFLTVDIPLFNLFSVPYRRPYNQTP